MRKQNSFVLTYVAPQSSHVITTKFSVAAVVMPPVLRDIKLRARITSHTSRISIHSQPIPSELTSTSGKVI